LYFKRLNFLVLIITVIISLPLSCSKRGNEINSDANPVEIKDTAAENDIITLHYHERNPYSHSTESGVRGFIAEPVETAFHNAGIPFEWTKTPSNRQLKIIRDNRGYDGIIGWFKNPERELYSRFSHFIYQDKPYIAIARSDNDLIEDNVSVETILSDKNLILEIKDGYSYGIFLDKKINDLTPRIDSTTTESIQMLYKLHMKRADYFFIAPEEADSLIAFSGLPSEDFKYIHFSDMPKGEKRFIMFSPNVNHHIIDKVNRELENLISGY
jgi:polar amino acid transport system substrate-binding protein